MRFRQFPARATLVGVGRSLLPCLCGALLALPAPRVRADVIAEGDVLPLIEVDGEMVPDFPVDGGTMTATAIIGVTDYGILSIDTPAFTDPLIGTSAILGQGLAPDAQQISQAIGQATISGFLSEWRLNETMIVAQFGQAYLTISSGGRLETGVTTSSLTAPDAMVGNGEGSQGYVNITGIGSRWRHDILWVGNEGHGYVTVAAGGRLETLNDAVLGVERDLSGDNVIGTAHVLVTGNGSRWNVVDLLTIGEEGRAEVEVRSGGWVRVGDDVEVGMDANSFGSITVSDQNSLFWALETLELATAGSDAARAELHIDNGGAARADTNVSVGLNGLIEFYSGLPNTPVSTLQTPSVTNAGVIRGFGRIESALVTNNAWIRNGTYSEGYREQMVFTGAVVNNADIESIGGEMVFEGQVTNNGANADILGVDAIFRFDGGIANTGNLILDNTVVWSPSTLQSAAVLAIEAGTSQVIGGVELLAANTMFVELGQEHSRLEVSGPVTLDGDLGLFLNDAYLPELGDSFEIIEAQSVTGTFDDILAPNISGFDFSLEYMENSVILNVIAGFVFSADFNGDGFVNGADLATILSNFGTGTTPMQGDADGDGDVDGNDFQIWQNTQGPVNVLPAVGAVPEPASAALAAMALMALGGLRRRPGLVRHG
ncbi:MAG TPA: hypothetical protein VEQ85_15710 [Lacipirellulaceae bacterium]|nr:hypothetical protein [Lacipirellulaceae bacterium]